MAKRFRKSYKKRFNRYRKNNSLGYSKRNGRKMKMTRYDGVVYSKCHYTGYIGVDPTVLINASYGFHWGS